MKIISGGQTGVDRAALDVAISLDIPHGGWCPKGRRAELEQVIPEKYKLDESLTDDFRERTLLNIRDSDGTLILVPRIPLDITDGTLLTIQEVKEKDKPYMIIDISKELDIKNVSEWVISNNIETLNVAGPRESQSPGIYDASSGILRKILPELLSEIAMHRRCYSDQSGSSFSP